MHNSFAEAIKDQTKGVLHQHVLLSLDQAVSAEQVARLPWLRLAAFVAWCCSLRLLGLQPPLLRAAASA